MGFDLVTMKAAVDKHGAVARICVTNTAGSTPRETGTSMLVWADGQAGTIGGGTLEFEASIAALNLLADRQPWARSLRKIPLGPNLGQCCGGTVSLLLEVYSETNLPTIEKQINDTGAFVRPVQTGETPDSPRPLNVERLLKQIRSGETTLEANLSQGWIVEPANIHKNPLWIFGAGHVGRALVNTLEPLPFDVTWIDAGADRFPDSVPASVTQLIAENPADLVRYAPADAEHLVLTYSHALDLEICHRLLHHGFAGAGLIGSATKWTRFQKRLRNLGHQQSDIMQIDCPIGRPELGKAPQAIAIGVASSLLLANRKVKTAPDLEKEAAR